MNEEDLPMKFLLLLVLLLPMAGCIASKNPATAAAPRQIIARPGFDVIGEKTWISGQDNAQFGQFWEQCRQEGLFQTFARIDGKPGRQTRSCVLGISQVEQDPSNRAFHYMIAIEKSGKETAGLKTYYVPPAHWAVFACTGKVPESIAQAERRAFEEWLPASGYRHAPAPEMEVYFHGDDGTRDDSYCEFWLPIVPQPAR